MDFHLNLQPLLASRPDEPAKPQPQRPYRVTYTHATGLHRITIKATDRFAAHDKAITSTPAGMTLSGLREIGHPTRRRQLAKQGKLSTGERP